METVNTEHLIQVHSPNWEKGQYLREINGTNNDVDFVASPELEEAIVFDSWNNAQIFCEVLKLLFLKYPEFSFSVIKKEWIDGM